MSQKMENGEQRYKLFERNADSRAFCDVLMPSEQLTLTLTSSEPSLLTFFMTLPVPRPLCMQWFVSDWNETC
jgi:hypothetical protein